MIGNNFLTKLKLRYSTLLSILVIVFFLEIVFVGLVFPKESGTQKEAVEEKAVQVKADKSSKEDKESASFDSPIFEMKRLKTKKPRYSIELRDVNLVDLFRVFAHDYKLNFLVDKEVKGEVTASFTNISLEEALERIAQMHNLVLKEEGNVIIVKPNLVTKMFILRYIAAGELLGVSKEKQDQKKQDGGEQGKSGGMAATVYDLLSPEGKILLGPQSNSIVAIDYPPNIEKVENFIMAVDQKMSSEVFKLKYLSVKDLFPDLVNRERGERKEQMDERKKERDEIKGVRGTTGTGD